MQQEGSEGSARQLESSKPTHIPEEQRCWPGKGYQREAATGTREKQLHNLTTEESEPGATQEVVPFVG